MDSKENLLLLFLIKEEIIDDKQLRNIVIYSSELGLYQAVLFILHGTISKDDCKHISTKDIKIWLMVQHGINT